jgi:intein-encoded DNA endonuclease-like protein
MPVINAYPSGFLQGFFDAEGSISFRETDRRNILQKSIELINGDDGLVLVTIKCLNTLGFSHVHYVRPPRDFYHRKWNKVIHQRIPLHHIALIREVDIRRFANVIGGFTEPAKQGKLMDLIGIMDKRAALRRPA